MFPDRYFPARYFPNRYFPPGGAEAEEETFAGGPGRKTYRTKWPKLGRRPSKQELQRFYEVLQAEAQEAEQQRASEAPALAEVADEVVETVRPYARTELLIPAVGTIDWTALIADQERYTKLLALYERAIRLDMEDWEDLLLIAAVAW